MSMVDRKVFRLSPSPPPFQPFDPSIDSLHLDLLQIDSDLARSQESRKQKNGLQTSAYIRVQTSSDPIPDLKNVTKWSDSSTAKDSGTDHHSLIQNDGETVKDGEDPSSSQSEKNKNKPSSPVGKVGKHRLDSKDPTQPNSTEEKIRKKAETEKKRKLVTSGMMEERRPEKRMNITQKTSQSDVKSPSSEFLKQGEMSKLGKDNNQNHDGINQLKSVSSSDANKTAATRKLMKEGVNASSTMKLTSAGQFATKKSLEGQKKAEKLQDISKAATHDVEKNVRVKTQKDPVQITNSFSSDVAMPEEVTEKGSIPMDDKVEQHDVMQDDYPLEYVDDPLPTSSPSKSFANLNLDNKRQEARSSVSSSHVPQGAMLVSTSSGDAKSTVLQSKHDIQNSKNAKANRTKTSASSKKSNKINEAERLKRLEDRRFGVIHSDEESNEDDVVEIVSIRNNSVKASSSAEKAPSIVKFGEHTRPKPIPTKRSITQNSADTVDSITQSTEPMVLKGSVTAKSVSTKRKETSTEVEKPSAKKPRKVAPYRARHSVLDDIKTPDMSENRSLADSAMVAYGFSTSTKQIARNVPTKEVRDIEKRISNRSEEPKHDSIDDDYDLDALLDRKAKDLVLASTSSLTPLEDESKEDGEISSASDSDSDSDPPAVAVGERAQSKKGIFKSKTNNKRSIKTDEALQLLPGGKQVRKVKKGTDTAIADRKLEFQHSQSQSSVTTKIGKKRLLPNGTPLPPVHTRKEVEDEKFTKMPIDRSDLELPLASTIKDQPTRKSTLGTSAYRRVEQRSEKAFTNALESASSPLTDISDKELTKSSRKAPTKASTLTAIEKATTRKSKGRPTRKNAVEPSENDAQKENNDDDLYMVPPGKPLKKATKRPLRGKKAQQNGALSPAILHENNELKAKFLEVDSYNIPEEKV